MRKGLLISGIMAALAAGVALWTVADGESKPQRHNADRLSSSAKWDKLVIKSEEEARSSALGPWPFAEVRQGPVMPERLQREVRHLLGDAKELELRFADASYALPRNGEGIWVIPGNRILCMVRGVRIAAACSTVVRAYRQGLVLQTYKHRDSKPTRFQVVGIVPDGIRTVPAKIGKHWTALNVQGNTFFAEAKKPIGVPLGNKRPG